MPETGAAAFARRFPRLFHVTRRSALASIERHGLRPAASFAPGEDANRDAWTSRTGPDGERVWLRWQRLGDHLLAKRLPPRTVLAEWRRLINSMVFLFPSAEAAERLRGFPADAGLEQVVISFEAVTLLRRGCDVRFCRWNNGFPDRRRPPRLRTASDYRPIADWYRGDIVAEVTIAGSIPAGVPFDVFSTDCSLSNDPGGGLV